MANGELSKRKVRKGLKIGTIEFADTTQDLTEGFSKLDADAKVALVPKEIVEGAFALDQSLVTQAFVKNHMSTETYKNKWDMIKDWAKHSFIPKWK